MNSVNVIRAFEKFKRKSMQTVKHETFFYAICITKRMGDWFQQVKQDFSLIANNEDFFTDFLTLTTVSK